MLYSCDGVIPRVATEIGDASRVHAADVSMRSLLQVLHQLLLELWIHRWQGSCERAPNRSILSQG
jgi:hypothetical protein